MKYFIILSIYFLATDVDTYRILGFFPMSCRSHNIFFEALMKGLAKRGHQIDVITHYELKNPPKNYKTIMNLANINFKHPKTHFDSIQESIDAFNEEQKHVEMTYGKPVCEMLSLKEMQQFLQNPPKDPPYDLIITEAPEAICFYGLGPFFDRPLITITASMEMPWTAECVGNPLSTAFFPIFFRTKFEITSFWDRFANTISAMLTIYKFYAYTGDQTEVMRKYLRPDIPTVTEVERMVALNIVNSHHTIQGIRPKTPAFIEVAGLHIEENDSKITTKLEKWLNDSENGALYFSLGSIIPIETLPNETILSIYSSFAKLAPMRVLIKATKGHTFPPGLPKNVITMIWAPQISILRHNNIRLFITHGGLHSVQEAIYYGIPIIGMPIFLDQHQNIDTLVKKKMGIQLDYHKITERSLDEALTKILKDSKYRESAKNLSRVFRDRPMSPMNTAAYWIEYVIKNGAQTLRSPAVSMYWWQVQLLDVYGFLLFCLLLVFYLITIIVKAIFKQFYKNNAKLDLKRD